MNKNLLNKIKYLGIFLLITGISYYLFDFFIPVTPKKVISSEETPTETIVKTGTFTGPKTEVCPINGQLYSTQEKAIWETRRPLLVMIENHEDSRPQSGLQSADIVYEAVAEGGITRFMGVFYCGIVASQADLENKYDVGPVRSARTYFLDIASEYADYPLYGHVGGANCSAATPGGPCTSALKTQAIEQIAKYGWNNAGTHSDLSQFALSYKACRREPDRTSQERATEHTMYCSTSELYNIAEKRGLTNETVAKKNSWDKSYRAWSFTKEDKTNGTDGTISFDFWAGYKDYSVSWKYNSANNNYIRSNGGQEQIDFNTQTALTSKNIVIQYVKETRHVDEHGHNLYDMIGTGKGILFQNGIKTEITWSKVNRLSRTIFKDSTGKEINFVPGNIWIEIIPIGNEVSVL